HRGPGAGVGRHARRGRRRGRRPGRRLPDPGRPVNAGASGHGPRREHRMRKLPALIAFAATGLLLSLAALGLLLFARSREAPAVGPLAAALAELRVLDFELTDDRGEPADESLFEGQVTILSFIFT